MRTALIGAVRSTQVALEAMARAGHPPVALVTLPLAKASRHSDYMDLRPLASALGLPLLEAPRINAPECIDALRALRLDHVFVIGWSQLIGAELLGVPRAGSIGYHPAALPDCRGRAVIPWTILLGKRSTGSTLFWLDEGTDSGEILGQECFPVDEAETAASLYEKHMAALDRLVTAAVEALAAGRRPATPQDHSRATYCAKRTERDGLVDWHLPAETVWRTIRALGDPYPGAFTFVDGRRFFLTAAERVEAARFHGLAGQVQQLDDRGAVVLCGDGNGIRITAIRLEPGAPSLEPLRLLKNHDRLGIDLLALLEGSQGGTGR